MFGEKDAPSAPLRCSCTWSTALPLQNARVTNAHSVTPSSSHVRGTTMRASYLRTRTSPAPASTQSAQAPVPRPNARTTHSCAEARNPVRAIHAASQSVHACSPHATCVRSFKSSDPHSRHTRMAGWIERRCTSYTRPTPSVSR